MFPKTLLKNTLIQRSDEFFVDRFLLVNYSNEYGENLMKKILLLDVENNTKTSAQILELFNEYQYVYIVYAMLKTNFDIDMVVKLSHFIQQERLFIHKMSKTGKNSADLGLAYIAGTLAHTCESDDEIHIMSADKMMSNIIGMLQAQKVNAIQILPFEPPAANAPCLDKLENSHSTTKKAPVLLDPLPSPAQNVAFPKTTKSTTSAINPSKKRDTKTNNSLKNEKKDKTSLSSMSIESIYQRLGSLIRKLKSEEGTYKRPLLNYDAADRDYEIAILVYCRMLSMLLRASVPKTSNGLENVLKSQFNGSAEIARLIAVLMARSKFLTVKDDKPKYTPEFNQGLIKAYLKKNNHLLVETPKKVVS